MVALLSTSAQDRPELATSIDDLEASIAALGTPPAELPVRHIFDVPGLYARQIFMPAGTLVTSKIHKTKHMFVVSAGEMLVWSEKGGAEHICAPFTGITEPGTRRAIYVVQDTIWTCFHVTDKKNVDEIEEDVILKHTNPLLTKGDS